MTIPASPVKTALLRKLIGNLRPELSGVELIRLGPEGDGGYLVPDDLSDIAACFSPGVGKISGFEKDCLDKGMDVFLADKSVTQVPENNAEYNFIHKYVGATLSDDFITLDHWVKTSINDQTSDLLLQIDIEGYEYETFLNATNKLLERFRIIVAEFHDLHFLFNRSFFTFANSVFNKILQTHACVHIHPNNCCGSYHLNDIEIPHVMEFTFYRRDRFQKHGYAADFPHALDFDNVPKKPTLELPNCWYGE